MRYDNAVAGAVNPTGSASYYRVRWPQYGAFGVTNSAMKYTTQAQGIAASSSIGGATVSTTYNATAGAVVARMPSANTPSGYLFTPFSAQIYWNVERGGAVVTDLFCWEFRLTCAFSNAGADMAALGDCGICLVPGNTSQSGNFPGVTGSGIEFGPRGAGKIALLARYTKAVGPLTINEAVSAANLPADTTKLNTYAVRIVPPTPSSDALVYALINGVQVTQKYSLSTAAALVPVPSVSGFFGYNFWVVNVSTGIVPTLDVAEIVVTGARNENDLV